MGIRHGALRTSDVTGSHLAAAGFAWFSGSGEMTLTTSDYFRCSFKNNSLTKTIAVAQLNLSATSSIFVASRLNATTNLPAGVRTVHNSIFDGRAYTGDVQVRADVSTLEPGGGTLLSSALAIGVGAPSNIPGPFIFPPGYSLTVWGHANGNNSASVNWSWIEFPTA